MKILKTINVKGKEDVLKYAYAFMKTERLNKKECGFLNPTPTKFDKIHLMPTDMYSATYIDKVPTWETFKTNKTHISSLGFSCVACLDTKDEKRVMLRSFGNVVQFNCYGDYENEAKNALEDIILIHSSLI